MAANGASMRRRNRPEPCAQRSGGGWATIGLQWVANSNVAYLGPRIDGSTFLPSFLPFVYKWGSFSVYCYF